MQSNFRTVLIAESVARWHSSVTPRIIANANMFTLHRSSRSACALLALGALIGVAHAEPLLTLSVVAGQTKGDGTVSLLLKVRDDSAEKDSSGEILTSLPPPGACSSKFTDEIGVLRPCYVVHLWENGESVPKVQLKVLDTIGADGWAVLTYTSPHTIGRDRTVRMQIATNGFYNANEGVLYDLNVVGRDDFDASHPYHMLYADADRDLNTIYKNRMRNLTAPGGSALAADIRNDERNWVLEKEASCPNEESDEAYRCRWITTVKRLAEISNN